MQQNLAELALTVPFALPVAVPVPPPSAAETQAMKLIRVAVDVIDTPPQARTFFDPEFISCLADAIRSNGQAWPIKVCRGDKPGRWTLVEGGQRYLACKEAGLIELQAIEVSSNQPEDKRLEGQLQENGLRTPLRPCEEAVALERLRQMRGCTIKELARAVKFDYTHVSRRLSLLKKYPPAQRAQIDAGEINEVVADEIAKTANEQDRLALFERAIKFHWTKEKAIAEVSALTKRRKSPKPQNGHVKRVTFRLGEQGATVTVIAPDMFPELKTEDVLFALEFAVREVKRALRQQVTAGELTAHLQKLKAKDRKAKGDESSNDKNGDLPNGTAGDAVL
ncbi:MAG TPA: ParB/RepB/Spo0J family partition protein [Gemmataceae bacterium]|nr:ParB/RepB/Spo0J family partition protein [Gemmataceae bacterium]